MTFLTSALIALHILGAAAIFGTWLATFKKPTVTLWQLVGAIVQVVTGLALVGIAEAGDGDVNHIKVAVKTVIAVIILVAAIIGFNKAKKGKDVPTGLAHAVGGMAFINILVATLWH
ncbi:MAG: hypothetical protein ACTII7_00130 [Galactobacter sp.]